MSSGLGNSLWSSLEGEILDGVYLLRSLIGEGGSGGVYLADHVVEGVTLRQVAVKLIAPKPETGDRELAELSAAASLRHPFLLSCFHAGSTNIRRVHLLYLVMELAESSLETWLERRLMSPVELMTCARQVGEALSFLHFRRFTHRDIKPANILCVAGQWKVSDFGAVRRELDRGRKTRTAVGTPMFMAPEALSGAITPAGDVWSYGATLMVALTGQGPYMAMSDQGLLESIRNEEPVIPTDLPAPFDTIIRGCLQRNPNKRWKIDQVLEALQPPDPTPQPAPSFTWLKPALGVVCALVAIEGVLLTSSTWIASSLAERLRVSAPVAARILAQGRTLHPGDEVSLEDITAELRQAGLTEEHNNPLGSYASVGQTLRIAPARAQAITVSLNNGHVERLTDPDQSSYTLPPIPLMLKKAGQWVQRPQLDAPPVPELVANALTTADEMGAEPLGRLVDSGAVNIPVIHGLALRRLRSRLTLPERLAVYYDRGVYGKTPGGNIVGVSAAARAYFAGKTLAQLTLDEAALLAALLDDPERADPSRHPTEAFSRRNAVLERMRLAGRIAALQARQAEQRQLPLETQTGEAALAPAGAPVISLLTPEDGDRVTTLQSSLQSQAEEQLRISWRRVIRDGARSAQMLLAAIDNSNGEVRALTGMGVSTIDNAGQLLKPHPVAAALQPVAASAVGEPAALNAVWIRWDDPRAINPALDTPQLRRLKVQPTKSDGSTITPLDLAAAYAAVANGGVWYAPTLKPSAISGGQSLWDQRVSYLTSSLLSDTLRRVLWSEELPPMEAAAGAAERRQAVWMAGSRGGYSCVVWMKSEGDEDGLYHEAVRAWEEFLNRVHPKPVNLPPSGITLAKIDRASGMLATPSCPDTADLAFIQGSAPTQVCKLHGSGQIATPQRTSETRTITRAVPVAPAPAVAAEPERRGIFGRLRSVFRKK